MSKEELKETIDIVASIEVSCETEAIAKEELMSYAEQLQQENEELKNKINNFNLEINKWLENSKAEMREYGDNREKYWEMFNQLLRKIKNKLIDISDYAVIDREREEELLNKEDILTEFEKWLEENYCLYIPEVKQNSVIGKVYDKLQELKEGKK